MVLSHRPGSPLSERPRQELLSPSFPSQPPVPFRPAVRERRVVDDYADGAPRRLWPPGGPMLAARVGGEMSERGCLVLETVW